jgi:hypothetical protein
VGSDGARLPQHIEHRIPEFWNEWRSADHEPGYFGLVIN